MGRLIYAAITSLDGYIEDESGKFDWSRPSQEVHSFVNDLERPIGTYLYGRRMYEVMKFWETAHELADLPPAERDYAAIWPATEKIVYSRSLETVESERTRIEREFDPEAVRALKAEAGTDISIGGPGIAGEALRAGLVDEVGLFVNPVAVGGGKAALPNGLRIDLELTEEHRFSNGVVFLRYRVAAPAGG